MTAAVFLPEPRPDERGGRRVFDFVGCHDPWMACRTARAALADEGRIPTPLGITYVTFPEGIRVIAQSQSIDCEECGRALPNAGFDLLLPCPACQPGRQEIV